MIMHGSSLQNHYCNIYHRYMISDTYPYHFPCPPTSLLLLLISVVQVALMKRNYCLVFTITIITSAVTLLLFSRDEVFTLKGQNGSYDGCVRIHQEQLIFKSVIKSTLKEPFSFLEFTPVSKDLVVYSAYYDNRSRRGHTNITMFFISANRTIFNAGWITGCGVGNTKASHFYVQYVHEDILMHQWLGIDKYPYEQLVVECYDLTVTNGSRAFVMYKTHNSTIPLVVESERPVMIPAPKFQTFGQHNFSVVVCTKAHNRGVSWLPEFLRYQKTLGVDHVHLTILDEFIKDEGFKDYILQDTFARRSVRNGFLSITVWKEWYRNNEIYVHSTILQYLDCIYRYRGTYDYVSLMDSDDFFTPRVPGRTFIKDYIQDYCYSKPAGSCTFKWLFYYPGICGMRGQAEEDGNVTAQLELHTPVDAQHKLKSIHSTAAIVDTSFHDATCKDCLLPGSKVMFVPSWIAYVVHNRMHQKGNYSEVCTNSSPSTFK